MYAGTIASFDAIVAQSTAARGPDWYKDAMQTRVQIVAIVVTAGLLVLVFELVRKRKLMERYSLLWLLAAACLLVLAIWRGLLTTLSHAVGIYYPPAALFAVAFAFVLVLLLHFSLVNSRLAEQSKLLAQRVGLLEQRIAWLEQSASAGDETVAGDAGDRDSSEPALAAPRGAARR